MRGINYFVFGGVNSEDYGVIMTAPPREAFAERDVEVVSVPGRSGDIYLDRGRYKNKPRTYPCAILPDDLVGTMREAAADFLGRIKAVRGYGKLFDTYSPGTFLLASLVAGIEVESIVEQAGVFEIAFDCKPQRYYDRGMEPIHMNKPGTIENAYPEAAKPIITVYGAGPGTLTVGNVTVEIKALEDQITIDSDTMNAYRQSGDGPKENRNNAVKAWEFPELLPGDNVVAWSGGISYIEIVPRWWSL